MPFRVVAMDCGASRHALAAFSARPDGSLVLEDLEFFPSVARERMGTPWIRSAVDALQSPGVARRFTGPLTISPPSHETLVKFLKIPQVGKGKRTRVIQFEAQQNIPYPLDEVVWSGEVVFEDADEFEIALVAARRELMEELCGAVRRAGLVPARIGPSSLTLHRAFLHNQPGADGPALLVDIGARTTELVFMNPPRFLVRSIPVGGNEFTQTLAGRLSQSFEEAEATKVRILSEAATPKKSSPVASAFARAAIELADKLGVEIARSTVVVRRQTGDSAPTTVYLTGGGSQVGLLQPLLAERLRAPIVRFEPFKRVNAPNRPAVDAHRHQLCGLIGMAVEAFERERSDAGGVDLLPPQVRKAVELRRRRPYVIAPAVLAAAALAIPSVHYWRELGSIRTEIETIDSLLAEPRANQARIRKDLRRIGDARGQAIAIGTFVTTRSNWIDFLSDLQRRLVGVGDVWIDRLKVIRAPLENPAADSTLFGAPQAPDTTNTANPGNEAPLRLFVAGRLIDRNNPVSKVSEDSTARVRLLMSGLGDSPFVDSVENERYDTTQPGILRFEFTIAVNPERPL